MSWYRLTKHAVTMDTMPYFEEVGEQYVPDPQNVSNQLQRKFRTNIVGPIGQGDSGVAYQLGNGDILKVTTNDREGQIAQWLLTHPHRNFVQFKDVWKQGNLWYCVMEKVQTEFPAKRWVEFLAEELNKNQCYDVNCAIQMLVNPKYRGVPFTADIVGALRHLARIPNVRPFDFLNPNNVGFKNGMIKFFDIT